MNIKGKEIVGIKIISTEDNTEVGNIKDIIYDPKKNKVIGFLVSVGDVLAEPKVILFKEIKNISKDSVLIKSVKTIQPGSKVIKPITGPDDSDTYIKDTNIVSDNGNALGLGKDIIFDTKTGQVTSFEVQLDDQVKQVKVASILASTEASTIIKEGDPQKSNESGGIMEKMKQLVGS